MTVQYPGSPVFPSDFPLVDDGVAPTGTNFNPALEALGDRTAYLKALADGNAVKLVLRRWLGSGSFTLPANALPWLVFAGCGGGGAGGRGGGSQPAAIGSSGGGGGGGAQLVSGICAAFPGESHSVTVGAGGTGVDGFGIGNYGGDTLITRDLDDAILASCGGAGGGHPGPLSGFGPRAVITVFTDAAGAEGPATQYSFARGGGPSRPPSSTIEPVATPSTDSGANYSQAPGAGGTGTFRVPGSLVGRPGIASGSFAGGFGGTFGTDNIAAPDRFGGGAGGGGGGGAYGVGGLGGNGTHATGGGGAADAPTAGASAAANTGAGGGGGGSAGSGDPQTTAGAAPGNGASGQITIGYWIPAELP